jgi:Ca2+-binding RTX toxin-like protein
MRPTTLISAILAVAVTVIAALAMPAASQQAGGRPSCLGRQATIVGTPGSDVRRGTNRADVIVTFGGNDRVLGRGGRDRICSGTGDDVVCEGTLTGISRRPCASFARGRVLGGGGNDVLRGVFTSGGRGNDDVNTPNGTSRRFSPRAVGGPGQDEVEGASTNDVLRGGRGRDRVVGEGGRDRLAGNRDNDQLFGGSGSDRLRGGGGRDLCIGGSGSDRSGNCER